jgi:TPR repeat protein
MKCILCKMCETAKAAVRRKWRAWSDMQMNNMEIWDRETERKRIEYAHSLWKTDPAQCFKEYLALSEAGSLWSAICVGAAFENGIGSPPDLVQAEKWYRRAYEGGSDDALLRLGALYLRSREYAKAEEVYRAGIERNLAPAMHDLAWIYWKSCDWRSRRDEARTLLERGSAAGDIFAKRFLASALARGGFGLRHIPEGFRLMFSVADEMAELIKDEELVIPDKTLQPGLLGYLSRLCPFLANRMPASQESVSAAARA